MAPTGAGGSVVFVSTISSDLARVHVREIGADLVIEVEVPSECELPRIAMSLNEGVLTIRLPRAQLRRHIPGFNPDASGV
jgi:hypothetical protein